MRLRIRDIEDTIDRCMLSDQHRFRRRLHAIRSDAPAGDETFVRLNDEIHRSMLRRGQRRANLPRFDYDHSLPIVQQRSAILRAIADHQVVIVCGETGSGKTTQLPKMCLELGRGVAGLIGHTQPRRIAARSVAARIASELDSALGQAVGYKVRFNDKLSDDTYIKVMTDGVLLAETQHDRFLSRYDTIIIDEAHERSLNVDFLLGYIKQLLPKRPELKVIVTSATINPQQFSAHFNEAPIIEVSGRVHPVEVRWRPVSTEEADEEDPSILKAIVEAIDEVMAPGSDEPGDVLVFLSGEREIREAAEVLRKHRPHGAEILPLYARQSMEDQTRVFQAPRAGCRRIVLATNVAETSLTVPGIRFVIDPGLARISRYSPNARVQRLPIEAISQASADQRKGRCGRIVAGVCVRLYSQEDYESRPRFTDPEILRANLASVILQMKALKLGEVERFPFMEPPRLAAVREGYQTLLELGALDERGEITKLGRELARWPLDPRIGRMILAAKDEGALREVLIMAAALSTQDVRIRPLDQTKLADAAHLEFVDERSDFLTFVKLWDFYHAQSRHLSTSKLRKLCQQKYLSYVRLREWHDVHGQLHDLISESPDQLNDEPASYENIHRALLTGLLANVGFKSESHEYTGVRDRKFHIFPGSGLFANPPKWIMAAEMVQTNRLYARIAARIHPEWIEQLAQHLVKRSHTAPYWNARTAHVEAFERVALHGLTIVPKRRVHFGKVDPKLAREVFIQHALVEGDYSLQSGQKPEFASHNQGLVEQVRAIESKGRRQDVMVGPEAMFAFYDRRIPEDVVNGPLFEKWRRRIERDDPQALFMSIGDLMQHPAAGVTAELYPDQLTVHGLSLPLEYRLAPGEPDDGVTLVVPVEAIGLLDAQRALWLIPGMLQEKIVALIKTLPKPLRRSLVPAPDLAEACAKSLTFAEGDLLERLAKQLRQRTGLEIPGDAWGPDMLPDYLRMNFRAVDAQGRVVASGRDLASLQRHVAQRASSERPAPPHPTMHRDHIVDWDFGELPDQVEVLRGAIALRGYPALIDRGDTVSLRVLEARAAADQAHRAGVRRLFEIQVRDELATHIDYLSNLEDLTLHYSTQGDANQLKRELADLVVDRVFLGSDDRTAVRSRLEFDRRLRSGWNDLWPAAGEMAALVGSILATHHEVDLRIADMDNPYFSESLDDIRRQFEALMPPGFLRCTPLHWLAHFPRFLGGISVRLRKLSNAGLARDQRAMTEIERHWTRCSQCMDDHAVRGIVDPALTLYRWLIEELRVSLFAQELGTSVPVSAKRLEKLWEQTKR